MANPRSYPLYKELSHLYTLTMVIEDERPTCVTDNFFPTDKGADEYAFGEVKGQTTHLKITRGCLPNSQPTGTGPCLLDEGPLANPRELVGNNFAGGGTCRRCGTHINYACVTTLIPINRFFSRPKSS